MTGTNGDVPVLVGMPKDLHEDIITFFRFYTEDRAGECDCDPSVGLNGCEACAAREIMERLQPAANFELAIGAKQDGKSVWDLGIVW